MEVPHVLTLSSSIKSLLKRKRKPEINANIANLVKKNLQHLSGYCSLKSRNTLHWYKTQNTVEKRRGVKVDKSFEGEVLGNVIICVFEETQTMRCDNYFYFFNSHCGSLRVCYPIQPIRCCFHVSIFVPTATTLSYQLVCAALQKLLAYLLHLPLINQSFSSFSS